MELICHLKNFKKEEIETAIKEVLEITMLKEFAHKLAKHLSGGMKRKLSLAIAIVSKPQILILDEPTSGLDEQSRTQVIRLIIKMKLDRAILTATQHLDEAE